MSNNKGVKDSAVDVNEHNQGSMAQPFQGQQPQYSFGNQPPPPAYGGNQPPPPAYGQSYPPGAPAPAYGAYYSNQQQPYTQPNQTVVFIGGNQPRQQPYGQGGKNNSTKNSVEENATHLLHQAEFSVKSVRRAFVRKVFAITGMMLSVVFGLTLLFTLVEDLRIWALRHPSVYLVGLVGFIVTMIALSCVESLRRSYPMNLVLLFIFTLFAAIITIFASATQQNKNSVLMAFGITVVVCGAVIIFASQTKYDITTCSMVLFVGSIILMLMGFAFAIVFAFYGKSKIFLVVYGGCGALLFSMFLAYDVQLIMGGKREEISPEEYILASIHLFIDILYIFLFILDIINGSQ